MPCTKGMVKCPLTCRHKAFVIQYQDQRQADEACRDQAVGTYGPESQEWRDYRPPPVIFQDWLIRMAGWGS